MTRPPDLAPAGVSPREALTSFPSSSPSQRPVWRPCHLPTEMLERMHGQRTKAGGAPAAVVSGARIMKTLRFIFRSPPEEDLMNACLADCYVHEGTCHALRMEQLDATGHPCKAVNNSAAFRVSSSTAGRRRGLKAASSYFTEASCEYNVHRPWDGAAPSKVNATRMNRRRRGNRHRSRLCCIRSQRQLQSCREARPSCQRSDAARRTG